MLITRTLLLHAKHHWPEMITTMLWPQALKAAETHLNHLPVNIDGKTSLSCFADVDCQVFARDFHTWGCPVFVLDGRLQSDPKGVPKYGSQDAELELYGEFASVCRLRLPSSSTQNPTTGPQFHVVFDHTFSTVRYMRNKMVPPHWAELVKNSTELATEENFDLAKTWFQTVDDPTESAPHNTNIITQDDSNAPVNEGAIVKANEGGTDEATISNPNDPFDPLQDIFKDDS
ncbi:hypothetical protein ACHAXS_004178 [Conticribra weissflogii]